MKILAHLRERLAWKLFLSYLVILFVAIVVLDITAELESPSTLARDITRLESLLSENPALAASLRENFSTAVNEILAIATLLAALAAAFVSLFTARRIVEPIQAMMRASQHIAAGDYHARVQIPGQDELGALAQSFNQMAEALDRTEHRRMELIGNVAHELRTPLANIKSSLEGLVDGVIPGEPETYMGLDHEVSRMQRLVRDLEELSRVEADQIRLELRPVILTELIGIIAERLRPQFEDKGVTLRFDVSPDLPRVSADANRMTQVLLNLLGNALQYTPTDGTVTIRAWHEYNDCIVAIQDTGIGVAPEHLPHLFERFYRVDKSRSRAGGGSGIGLTIAKHLIEAHGGRIWITSPGTDQGSTISFALQGLEYRP